MAEAVRTMLAAVGSILQSGSEPAALTPWGLQVPGVLGAGMPPGLIN